MTWQSRQPAGRFSRRPTAAPPGSSSETPPWVSAGVTPAPSVEKAVSMNREGYIKWLKWMVVLGALAAAGLRVGFWSLDSSPTPQAAILPAQPPIALADLNHALDAEFAPVVKDGLLRTSTGCGVAIGVIDHEQRRVFTYGSARADSIFQIGSITKTFTGLALAQLAVQR